MADLKQFLLPDVGEGLTEADIIRWDVAPGDTVTVNQTLVEIETAKAAVELPSPFAGVVTELHVAAGDTVDVGRPIITIDVAPGAIAPVAAPSGPGIAGEGRQPVLVGYGPRADGPGRRRPRVSGAVGYAVAPDPAWSEAQPEVSEEPDDSGPWPAAPIEPIAPLEPLAAETETAETAGGAAILTKPPVRLLARNLGVDLASISPTGPNGSVSRADVEQAAGAGRSGVGGVSGVSGVAGVHRAERETRIPVRGVRRHTAAAMVESAFTAPHVSVFQTVDVTAMMQLRERIGARPEFSGLKVSPLLLLAKAVVNGVAATPEINASWDEAGGEIVLKHYVNLGIAAATPRGLIVPNIKDTEQLSLRDLASALAELTETARAGRTTPADLAGGTITITNIGVFGVDTGTPILNPGEAGIVAFGAVARRPWVVDEQIVPRWVTTLALSFDHRIVDGQQGARFLSSVAAILNDPGLALLG